MKKLLIVNNNLNIGGVQKSLYNLLWSLPEDYEVTLYLFYFYVVIDTLYFILILVHNILFVVFSYYSWK